MFTTRRLVSKICNTLRRSNTKTSATLVPFINALQVTPKQPLSTLPLQTNKFSLAKPQICSFTSQRSYAKGKDKKKDKVKSKVSVNENQLAEVVNVETLKNQMQKVVVHMEEEFIKHLSLRSTTGAIESLSVNLDGKEHKLQELAQIIRKNPKTIVLNFAVFPQSIPAALKALSKSGMNLNPQQDGTSLFIPIPKVTKEHREQLSKNAKQLFVKCKDSVRDVQNKMVKQVKNKDRISEDLARSVEQQIVAVADQYIAEAESILNRKQTELLGEK